MAAKKPAGPKLMTLLRAPPLLPVDVEVGEEVVEERTEVRVEREEGDLVEVGVGVVVGVVTGVRGRVEVEVTKTNELLPPETVERGEPAGEATELEAEQSVVTDRG